MKIFGLYITTAKAIEKERAEHKAVVVKRKQDNGLWDRITKRMLYENFVLRTSK